MKFGVVLKTQGIPEWKEMYLNYKILKSLVKPYKTMSKVYMNINFLEQKDNPDHTTILITNSNVQFFEDLKEFGVLFEEIVMNEFTKISNFFEYKLVEELRRWKLFKINITILQNIQNDKDYDLKKIQLLNAFHFFYKELNLLYEYVSVNQEGLRKIIKKFKKNSKTIDLRYKSLKRQIREMVSKSFLKNAIQKLIFLRTEVEQAYIDTFYKKYDRKDGQNTLRKISQGKLMTHQQTFLFGFFLGFVCLLFLVIVTLSWLMDLEMEMLDAFSLFKGIMLIILFYWTLAINVYFWMKYNINYKLIFQFNFHFSEISEIFKRAAIFTVILLVMVVWFMLLEFQSSKLSNLFELFPKNLAPIIVWAIFFGYCLFPSTQFFNPLGRIYMIRYFKDIVCSLFQKANISFRTIWGLDQFLSFSGVARDMNYMFILVLYPQNEVNKECFLLGYILILVTVFMKIVQSSKLLYFEFTWKSMQIINIIKDICLFNVVYNDLRLFSHDTEDSSLIFALILSVFQAGWDIVVDWALLKKDSEFRYLRKELSFETPYVYYSFIISNFFFRICWILSMIPKNFQFITTDAYALLLIEIVEIVRRGIWNFLIIEKQHIMNCGIFKAVEEIKLPYEDIQFELDELHFYEEDLKLNVPHLKKLDSDAGSPFLKNKSRSTFKMSIKTKPEENFQDAPSLKIDELFSPACGRRISENPKYSKEFFEKLISKSKEFCKDVKFNMEFNFKVVKKKETEIART